MGSLNEAGVEDSQEKATNGLHLGFLLEIGMKPIDFGYVFPKKKPSFWLCFWP